MTLASTLLAADEPNPLVPHPSELIVGLVAFALLYLFLSRRVFPIFEKTFADRRNQIQGGIERAEAAQAEARQALEQYRAQLADARGEANRIREDARVQGQQILDELRTRAQDESARIMERGEIQLAAERQQVVTSLRSEVGQLAVDLSERIVRVSLRDDDRQRQVIDAFLADLENGDVERRSASGGVGSGAGAGAGPAGSGSAR